MSLHLLSYARAKYIYAGSLLVLGVSLFSCKINQQKIDLMKMDKEVSNYRTKYGYLGFGSDTVLMHHNYKCTYKKGVLIEMGKLKKGHKCGRWYEFIGNLELAAVIRYTNDTTYVPVTLINSSW